MVREPPSSSSLHRVLYYGLSPERGMGTVEDLRDQRCGLGQPRAPPRVIPHHEIMAECLFGATIRRCRERRARGLRKVESLKGYFAPVFFVALTCHACLIASFSGPPREQILMRKRRAHSQSARKQICAAALLRHKECSNGSPVRAEIRAAALDLTSSRSLLTTPQCRFILLSETPLIDGCWVRESAYVVGPAGSQNHFDLLPHSFWRSCFRTRSENGLTTVTRKFSKCQTCSIPVKSKTGDQSSRSSYSSSPVSAAYAWDDYTPCN